MKTRTQLLPPKYTFKIAHTDPILSLGSCFSLHMSDKLTYMGYHVRQNPCGITFNPASLLTTIQRVKNPDSLHESQLNFHNSLFSHPDFHSSFNKSSADDILDYAKTSLIKTQKYLTGAKYVFITIGTCFVYRDNKTTQIVNNCHKLPTEQFTRELLSLQEVSAILDQLRQELMDSCDPKLQLVWTVSPVRHTKNGLVDDRKSKSTALLAIHELVTKHENCHYFPSYELMVDDLRDYRYYDRDMIHPSSLAVDMIFDMVKECLLLAEEAPLRAQVKSVKDRMQHRALFPESESHRLFLEKLDEDKERLLEAYPYLDLT